MNRPGRCSYRSHKLPACELAFLLLGSLAFLLLGSLALLSGAEPDHKFNPSPQPYPAYPPGGHKDSDKPIPGFEPGPERKDILPGRFVIDPPTLENLGFRWYIADNVLTGVDVEWHPYKKKGKSTGVSLYGQGHVICHNHVSGFGDSIAIYNRIPVENLERHCVAIDMYNNDLTHAWDDCVETDSGVHNVRVYRNRCRNAHTGLSAQPFFGGPVYFVRNEVYGVTNLTFKLNCMPTGIEAYNNTACAATCAGSLGYAQNMHFRNNLIMGGNVELFAKATVHGKERERMMGRLAHALGGGTFTPSRSTMDYNGYYGGANPEIPLMNWRHGQTARKCRTLEEFTAYTGYEKHGRLVGYRIFQKAGPPEWGQTYESGDYDLRLKPNGKAIDAGMPLPNVTDAFAGKAPDLGCYEVGTPLPHYGPRPQSSRSEEHIDIQKL